MPARTKKISSSAPSEWAGVDHFPGSTSIRLTPAVTVPGRRPEVAPRAGDVARLAAGRLDVVPVSHVVHGRLRYRRMAEPTAVAPAAEEVVPGVWSWGVANERIGGAESTGHAVAGADGVVLVDPVRLAPDALARLGDGDRDLPHRAVPPAVRLALPPRAGSAASGRRRGRGRWRRSPTGATGPATSSRAASGRCTPPGPRRCTSRSCATATRAFSSSRTSSRTTRAATSTSCPSSTTTTRRRRGAASRASWRSTSTCSASITEARSSTIRNPRSARSSLEPRARYSNARSRGGASAGRSLAVPSQLKPGGTGAHVARARASRYARIRGSRRAAFSSSCGSRR